MQTLREKVGWEGGVGGGGGRKEREGGMRWVEVIRFSKKKDKKRRRSISPEVKCGVRSPKFI